MALITITGYPCSGKSTRVQQLSLYLERRVADPSYEGPRLRVSVLSDDILNISRRVYDDSRSEKLARAALFTAMQRQMSQDVILIVDAPNYIKGFRYQMYCAARELKLRVCTMYVVATAELCRERNVALPLDARYHSETLENLIARYEEPSSMVRWDSPLFTVPWTEDDVPGEHIWNAVTKGDLKAPNVGTQAVAKAPTDALHTLEHTTALIVTAILNEQTASQGLGGPTLLSLSATITISINLPFRSITLSELQRLKRQFVAVHKKAITLGTIEKGDVDWGMEKIASKFTAYLEENLKL